VRILRNLVACHHEYLDGSGYPNGLRGDAIPIEARITTVSDIFDALSSQRVYKPRWTVDETIERLDVMVEAGKIDRDCVAALKAGGAHVREIMERFKEE
jgi:HD-GYP domain-containing protein (c-di-GMP phosphodiesterase class II)